MRTQTFLTLEFSSMSLNMVVISVDIFFFGMKIASDRKFGSRVRQENTFPGKGFVTFGQTFDQFHSTRATEKLYF